MTSVQKVLVVGGGIGGLVGALALRLRQIEVEIVEINPRWEVYGIGIIVQANALRALVALEGYLERRYARCRAFVEIANELACGEIENDRSVDVAGLAAQTMRIAAQPL